MILWLGFALRLHQLGCDSFWNDEAGQALAATQPTLREMLAMERAHVMAMPLDYLISRAVSRVGLTETVMRFPSVIWGMLALAACFSLARRVTGLEAAMLATFLLGISELHIHYSQEMRFYSALVFFYVLSTYLLLRALDKPSFWGWVLYVSATVIGVYFHPFVLLSGLNGFACVLMGRPARCERKQCFALAISFVLVLVAFLPGYLYFGSHQQYDFDLWQWSPSLGRSIAQVMGWRPLSYSASSPPSVMRGSLVGGFCLLGAVASLTWRFRLCGFLLSLPVQAALVIFTDWAKGYWFISRQLVHLHPVMLIFSGVGVVAIYRCVLKLVRGRSWFASLVLLSVVGMMGLSNIPILGEYYEWPKSIAREIAQELIARCQAEETVLVIPSYEGKVYRFYFQALGKSDLIAALRPVGWNELEQALPGTSAGVYLIAPVALTPEQLDELHRLGFVPLLYPEKEWYRTQALFVRASGSERH